MVRRSRFAEFVGALPDNVKRVIRDKLVVASPRDLENLMTIPPINQIMRVDNFDGTPVSRVYRSTSVTLKVIEDTLERCRNLLGGAYRTRAGDVIPLVEPRHLTQIADGEISRIHSPQDGEYDVHIYGSSSHPFRSTNYDYELYGSFFITNSEIVEFNFTSRNRVTGQKFVAVLDIPSGRKVVTEFHSIHFKGERWSKELFDDHLAPMVDHHLNIFKAHQTLSAYWLMIEGTANPAYQTAMEGDYNIYKEIILEAKQNIYVNIKALHMYVTQLEALLKNPPMVWRFGVPDTGLTFVNADRFYKEQIQKYAAPFGEVMDRAKGQIEQTSGWDSLPLDLQRLILQKVTIVSPRDMRNLLSVSRSMREATFQVARTRRDVSLIQSSSSTLRLLEDMMKFFRDALGGSLDFTVIPSLGLPTPATIRELSVTAGGSNENAALKRVLVTAPNPPIGVELNVQYTATKPHLVPMTSLHVHYNTVWDRFASTILVFKNEERFQIHHRVMDLIDPEAEFAPFDHDATLGGVYEMSEDDRIWRFSFYAVYQTLLLLWLLVDSSMNPNVNRLDPVYRETLNANVQLVYSHIGALHRQQMALEKHMKDNGTYRNLSAETIQAIDALAAGDYRPSLRSPIPSDGVQTLMDVVQKNPRNEELDLPHEDFITL